MPAVLTPPRVVLIPHRHLRSGCPAPPLPPLALPPAEEGEPDVPPCRRYKGLPLRACARCRVVRPVGRSGVCRGCLGRRQGRGKGG
jgi:hypothetical protein